MRSALRWLIIVFILPARAAAGVVGSEIFQVALRVVFDFVNDVCLDGRFRLGQDLSELLQLSGAGCPLLVGELDVDYQVQVAASVAAFVWHAFTRNLQDLVGVKNLTWLLGMSDLDAAPIKVFHYNAGEAGQGLCERDVESRRQVCTSSSERGVFYLSDMEDDIARFLTRDLIRFAFQDDLISFPASS